MLAATHSAMRRLKVRHTLASKAFASKNVFARECTQVRSEFSLGSREWSLNQLFSDSRRVPGVFERTCSTGTGERLDEKLRSVAHRLDLGCTCAVITGSA